MNKVRIFFTTLCCGIGALFLLLYFRMRDEREGAEEARLEVAQLKERIAKLEAEKEKKSSISFDLSGSAKAPQKASMDISDPRMAASLREIMSKNVALTYSDFFANCTLTREEKDALFDLLVDQMVSSTERNIQGPDADAKNRQMIESLIGGAGMTLQDSMVRQVTRSAAIDAARSVFKTKTPSSDKVSNLQKTITGNFPAGYGGEAIANKKQITDLDLQNFDKRFDQDLNERLNSLKSDLSSDELAAYELWAREEYKKTSAFWRNIRVFIPHD